MERNQLNKGNDLATAPKDVPGSDFVERNGALRFAHCTRANLLSIEALASSDKPTVYPVTQLMNPLLGMTG